jgi:cell division protein FtsL
MKTNEKIINTIAATAAIVMTIVSILLLTSTCICANNYNTKKDEVENLQLVIEDKDEEIAELSSENQELYSQNYALLQEKESINKKVDREVPDDLGLEPCYLCEEQVTVFMAEEETAKIQCKNCGLETSYFNSIYDLIQYWNRDYFKAKEEN